jgi:hypothetical protein
VFIAKNARVPDLERALKLGVRGFCGCPGYLRLAHQVFPAPAAAVQAPPTVTATQQDPSAQTSAPPVAHCDSPAPWRAPPAETQTHSAGGGFSRNRPVPNRRTPRRTSNSVPATPTLLGEASHRPCAHHTNLRGYAPLDADNTPETRARTNTPPGPVNDTNTDRRTKLHEHPPNAGEGTSGTRCRVLTHAT